MHRLFIALRPPPVVRDLLVDARDDTPDLRWVDDDQLHLTLRFVGEVDGPTADDLDAALAAVRFNRFDLMLSGVGMFEHRGAGSVWAGVHPPEPVRALAARIERQCQLAGLPAERRAFHPHVTLARFRRGAHAAAADYVARRARLETPAFPVECIHLVESHLSRHGAHHVDLAVYRSDGRGD